MPNPGWYNDNQFRDWPFITRLQPIGTDFEHLSSSSDAPVVDLPHSAIVDFVAIMEIDAEYTEEAGHFIYLYSIERAGTTFTFTFRSNAPETGNYEVQFERDLTDPEFLMDWAEAVQLSAEPTDSLACGDEPRWKAFLVTGNLVELGTEISSGETVTYAKGLWQVEPSRVQSLKDSYLRGVNLGNLPRTQVTLPPGCSESGSAAIEEPYIDATCLAGDIKWTEGFNCSIRQDAGENAIVIGAGVGSGEGEPCEEVSLFAGESPPQLYSPYLSGGPGCGDILKTLNGVGGRRITIKAGQGFRVFADPVNSNTLILDKALDDFALCLGGDEGIPSSMSSVGA